MDEIKNEGDEKKLEEKDSVINYDINMEKEVSKKKMFTNKRLIPILGIALIVILLGIIAVPKIQKNLELNKSYNTAVDLFNEKDYEKAAEIFSTLEDYKDSKDQYLNSFYCYGLKCLDEGKYSDAIKSFEKSEGYKDSNDKILEAHFKLGEQEYNKENYGIAAEELKKAGDFEGALEQYTKSVYEYGKSLVALYAYSDAVEQFKLIDYQDSKELANLYEQFEKTRCIDGKFRYKPKEFALILTDNFRDNGYNNYSASLGNVVDNQAIIELKYSDEIVDSVVLLEDIDDSNVSIGKISILLKNIGNMHEELEVYAVLYCIYLSDISLSFDEVKELGSNMMFIGSKTQRKNGIIYESTCNGTDLGLTIYAEVKQDSMVETNKTSKVEEAYDEASSLTIDDLDEDNSLGFTMHSYGDFVMQEEDEEWINSSFNKEGTVEDGALYRTMAMYLEGFSIGNPIEKYSKVLTGKEFNNRKDLKPYVDNAMEFISTKDNTRDRILKKLDSLKSVKQEFNKKKKTYHIQISDLTKCAKEMKISEQMLGYIFAHLNEYGAEIKFNGNSCKINLKIYGEN
ncbi:hypothetical protein P261_00450 [Lachnospiraceae bacterium TWA4]|nr:hypothetical protein P261_00450 [Lachnospiraceae bacterium TWA4]